MGSVTGITQAQLDRLLSHPRNHGLWCQAPPESGSQPIAVGPEVDPEIWWVVPEDNPFSIGPLQVGQGMVGGRGLGQDLAPCPLVTSEAGPWRVRSHKGGPRLMGQRGWFFPWISSGNKA